MKKKVFFVLFAAIAGTSVLFAQEGMKERIGDFYYILYYNTAELYCWAEYDIDEPRPTHIDIPARVKGEDNYTYTVTKIGDYAFYEWDELLSVTIPNTVTSIGNNAFRRCSSLPSIEIPNSVTSIGNWAFCECTGLTSLTIPNSVTSIGEGAFKDCTGFTSVTIPNSVTIIESEAFYRCSSLTSVTIGNGLIEIWSSAFNNCRNLTSVIINSNDFMNSFGTNFSLKDFFGNQVKNYIIGDEVTSIGDYAFNGCGNLTSVTIPNSVTSIGYGAFAGCYGLTSITIPNSVTSIGSNAFYNCSGLTSITIPNSVTYVGGWAFEGCGFTSVTIPNSVYYVNNGLFHRCGSLTSVTLPDNLTIIGDYAFWGCSKLSSINFPNNVTYIGEGAFYNCSSFKDFQIPEKVTHIREYTFADTGIESLTIPAQVDSVDKYAFLRCNNLKTLIWNAPKASGKDAHAAFADCKIESITIGEEVDSISDFCFEHSNKLNYQNGVNSGGFDSLKTVIWNAKHCNIKYNYGLNRNLKQIIFGNKVEYIPEYLCRYSNIKSVVIPNSVKTIGSDAFYKCLDLESVIIGDGLKLLGGFYGSPIKTFTCYATTPPTLKALINNGSAKVYVPASSVNAYKAADCWKEHTILPIGATATQTDNLQVTLSYNYADIVWKAIANAASYELVIECMGITLRFTFNAEGVLTSMTNQAPARHDALQGMQSAGFSYTVIGLESDATYNVTITAKAANGSTLNTETATFTTAGAPEGIEDVKVNNDNTQNKKIMRDGNVYILRGDKIYTATGAEVK